MTNGSDEATAAEPRYWFQGVPRYAWVVLALAAMGWLFDTMDQNLFNLVRQSSVTELLKPHIAPALLDASAKNAGGQLTAIFLLGWAAGGFIFGILGDRLGRTRTMIATICIYALFTGLNAFVHTFWQYAACRFLTAMGVGGEFAAGTALVAEIWPARSRPMALGALQASSAVGNILAATITLVLSGSSWRIAYMVGAAPALLVLWIRRSVREPEKWQEARANAASKGELGNILSLWREPVLRRNTIAGVLIALAGVGGLWGVGFFFADLVQTVLKPVVLKWPEVVALHGPAHDQMVKTLLNAYKSKASMMQNFGAFFGMFTYAALSQKTGRKPALYLFFVLAFVAVEATFHFLHDVTSTYLLAFPLGFCALAPFSAYAVYFPELYPTRLRSTGIGFCYNCARLFAAAAPFALGSLSKIYADHSPVPDESAGLRTAASIIAFIYAAGFIGLMFAPETKGKPLPE